MKKTLQIFNSLAFFATLYVNYLSNTGLINDNTNATVSRSFENLFTPAGYAFSIWGIIYLLLFAFVIYQGRSLFKKAENDGIVEKIGWWFIISCTANALWLFAWLHEMLLLSVGIMVVLLLSLIQIVLKTGARVESQPLAIKLFVWLPFSMYLGWISVALIANLAALLMQWSWDGFGISEVFWTIFMICIAGIVNIWVTRKRNMPVFSLVGIWALVAIAMANKGVEPIIVTSAYVVAGVLLIHVLWLLLNRKPA
jgi:hypothetical protein